MEGQRQSSPLPEARRRPTAPDSRRKERGERNGKGKERRRGRQRRMEGEKQSSTLPNSKEVVEDKDSRENRSMSNDRHGQMDRRMKHMAKREEQKRNKVNVITSGQRGNDATQWRKEQKVNKQGR